MPYLIDTNVVSVIAKRRRNSGVLDWLTATKARGWTLVTRNLKDFANLGIDLHNPFTEEVDG
jgi:predicted nucleic acid-binding protein